MRCVRRVIRVAVFWGILYGMSVGVGRAQAQAPTAGVIEVRGARLPYLIEGQGTPCLVYGSSLYYPRTFSERFKATFRCAHVTQRGFVPGATRRAEDVPFDIEEAVRDLEAARQQLGLERVVVIGHSIHGLVALAYAARHPQHVTHVVAIGAPPSMPPRSDSVRAYRDRMVTPGRQAQHRKNRAALDSLVLAHPGRRGVATYIANAALYWADSTFDATPLWADMGVNAALETDLYRPFAWDSTAPPVAVPAFVAVGHHDYVVPPSVWDGMRLPFESLTVERFDAAGHTPQLEVSNAFDRTLMEWIARHR